jgi:hypothetical protein
MPKKKFLKPFISGVFSLIFVLCFLLAKPANAGSLENGIEEMATTLVGDIIQSGKMRVGVVEFTTIGREKSDFGMLVAEKLSTDLKLKGKDLINLMERSQVDKFMQENPNLTAEEASNLLKTDIMVTGTYAVINDRADINAKAIDTGTGQNIATAKCIVNVKDYKKLLRVKVPAEQADIDWKERPLTLTAQILGAKWIDGQLSDVVIREGDTLYSKDRFRINLRTSNDCYFYVLLFSSQNEASILFPNPKIAMDNYIRGNVSYSLPGERLWFFLDEQPGTESFYFVASYEPMHDIAELLAEMNRARDDRKKDLVKRIRGAMDIRGIGGITSQAEPIAFSDPSGHKSAAEVIKGTGSLMREINIIHR